jgi:hypothetical protein
MMIFLKKSEPENLPNTSSEILPSTSVAINVKFDIADFFNQFSPLLYHQNHLFHHHFVSHMFVIVNYYYLLVIVLEMLSIKIRKWMYCPT